MSTCDGKKQCRRLPRKVTFVEKINRTAMQDPQNMKLV